MSDILDRYGRSDVRLLRPTMSFTPPIFSILGPVFPINNVEIRIIRVSLRSVDIIDRKATPSVAGNWLCHDGFGAQHLERQTV